MLRPYENALLLNLLRYHQELRKVSDFEFPSANIKAYKISAKEIEIAKQLVNGMTTKWDPKDYHDVFRETLPKWVETKTHHKKVSAKKIKTNLKKSNVIDFVDLLRKNLEKNK